MRMSEVVSLRLREFDIPTMVHLRFGCSSDWTRIGVHGAVKETNEFRRIVSTLITLPILHSARKE